VKSVEFSQEMPNSQVVLQSGSVARKTSITSLTPSVHVVSLDPLRPDHRQAAIRNWHSKLNLNI
jgi:hypothetical protein